MHHYSACHVRFPWDSATPYVIPVLCGVSQGGRGISSSVLNPLVTFRSSGRASAKCNPVFWGRFCGHSQSEGKKGPWGEPKMDKLKMVGPVKNKTYSANMKGKLKTSIEKIAPPLFLLSVCFAHFRNASSVGKFKVFHDLEKEIKRKG